MYNKDELFKFDLKIRLLVRNIILKYPVFRGTLCYEITVKLNLHKELFNKLYMYLNTDLITFPKTHFKICFTLNRELD